MGEELKFEGSGRLGVVVRTASGALPLENALVTVRSAGQSTGDGIASAITDRSGAVPYISLPAPSRYLSESPSASKPYATYNIEVTLAGYYANVYQNVPVFDGITSVQTAQLVPLPEDIVTETPLDGPFVFNEDSYANLEGGKG